MAPRAHQIARCFALGGPRNSRRPPSEHPRHDDPRTVDPAPQKRHAAAAEVGVGQARAQTSTLELQQAVLSDANRRTLVSIRMFEPSTQLVAALREQRRVRGTDDMMQTYDAFMLDPGLGPAVYLSSDGRIVWDDDGWGVPGTRADAFASILAGVKKTGIAELLALLPPRTTEAIDCPHCAATGWFDAHGQLKDVNGRLFSVVCMKCAGLGWTDPSILLSESILETRPDETPTS
jgi:hypothetical protein